MSDAHWAARQGDALAHSSVMADVFGGALEVVATVAAGAAVTAAVVAAAGVTVATGGLGACVLGAVVGAAVTVGMELTGADDALSTFCHDLAGDLFPPTVCAHITSGSPDVFINGLPAARAAGSIAQSPVELPEDEAPEGTFLDIAKGFFSELWRPTVATPDPRAMPQPLDRILCDKHPGMPGQYLAEGSSTVFINGQPAVRSGDRSACDAVVVASGSISPNVRIGGGKAVVRTIRSGKTPGVGLAVSALLMLRGGPAKFVSNLPCLLLGGASAYVAGAVGGALARAVSGSPNPVHAATGAKVLGGDEDLDFVLPGVLPIEWQRFYSSRDERPDGLFGVGWSVPFEVCVRIDRLAEGGERLIYIDEQARHIDMGSIAPGSAVFSAGEGLTVKRHTDGRVLIESEEGTYRLFEPTLLSESCLRLSQLGDRNDNRIHLIYDAEGRLCRLHDTLDVVRVTLVYSALWPRRVERIERLFDDDTAETMARYTYDDSGQLTEVYDALGKLQRQFAYHLSLRMAEHRLPTGLRCFYEWTLIDEREWRVVRHWTDDGSEYRFEYDLTAGITTVVDGLNRRSTRRWNAQHQITEYTDNLEVLRTQWQHETRSEYDRHRRLSARERMGRRAFAELPVRSVRTYEYDLTDNLIARVHSLSPGEHRTQLGYDSTHRVTLAQSNMNGLVERFAYDPAANLLSGPQTPGRQVVHNKLLNFQDKHYRYDSFGRLSEKRSDRRGRQRFAYDAESRLIEVRNPEGHVIRMTYDPLGRRVGKTLFHPDGHILCDTTFAWDGLRLLREEQNGFPTLYLYADHGYEPLARIDGRDDQQRIRYYHNDSSGVPEQLTEADGYLIWQTRYEVWGNTVGEDRERYFVENQNLRFQGQYLDRETGLHYNTFRYYDPDIGRFTTPDPIGLAGGLNLYQYAPNPIGWVDPWGWSCTPNKKSSYQGSSRRDAFRQARLDAGVPLSQQPYAVSKPYLEDGYGGYVYKDYKKIQTRSYHFMTNDGKKLIIQDHSYGHVKAMPKHGAEPHFNVRPIDKPQNGSVEGTYGYYNY
ncbi:RHS repeat-associated core domain-containing protein [Pseudomonas sp. Pseu.R1]|uniref:RHS repeat-associated core domain-containing protein n=1 Tax=Pseudomonas sp. Pseu.R1 TaxID=3379818 RepID=UPI003B93D7B2